MGGTPPPVIDVDITGVRFFGIRFRGLPPEPALNGLTFFQLYSLISLEP